MQVVGLELFRRDALQQKRQQRDLVSFRQSGKYVLELRDVGFAVIGRQLHADQQDFGFSLFDLRENIVQVAFDIRRAEAAQAVIRAEFYDDDSRTILFQQLGKPLTPAQRSFSADAGIDDVEFIVALIKLLL